MFFMVAWQLESWTVSQGDMVFMVAWQLESWTVSQGDYGLYGSVAVESWTVSQKDQGLVAWAVSFTPLCLLEETRQAVGPFYLVSTSTWCLCQEK